MFLHSRYDSVSDILCRECCILRRSAKCGNQQISRRDLTAECARLVELAGGMIAEICEIDSRRGGVIRLTTKGASIPISARGTVINTYTFDRITPFWFFNCCLGPLRDLMSSRISVEKG